MAEDNLYFLYASQTGTAETITKQLHHHATVEPGTWPGAKVMDLNEFDKLEVLHKQTDATSPTITLVILVSTTGDGEIPDNGTKFKRFLRNSTSKLCNTRYTLLALGDTNYNLFCGAGKYCDEKLEEKGAKRFYARGEADDAMGLESVVDPWTAGLWEALANNSASATKSTFRVAHSEPPHLPMDVPLRTVVLYDAGAPIVQRLAMTLFERILELGGTCSLLPFAYATAAALDARNPEALVFIWGGGRNARSSGAMPPASASLFDDVLMPQEGSVGLAQFNAFAQWLAGSSVVTYATLCVPHAPEQLPLMYAIDASLTQVMDTCQQQQIVDLGRRDKSKEAVPLRVVSHPDDLFRWCILVLDRLPGIVADTQTITDSLDKTFGFVVDAAPPAAAAANTSSSLAARKDNLVASASKQRPDHMVHAVLTQLVFLHAGDNQYIVTVAHDVQQQATKRGIDSTIAELGSFKSVGFPRRGFFVFVVGPGATGLPKSLTKLLKALKGFAAQSLEGTGGGFDAVQFAILGIDNRSTTTNFNFAALELECALLQLRARKFHATGLADSSDDESLQRVFGPWTQTLWCSIAHPMASVAYLDDGHHINNGVHGDGAQDGSGGRSDEALHNAMASPAGFFPWEPVAMRRDAIPRIQILLLYSSSGMAKTMALQAMKEALDIGFRVRIMSFRKAVHHAKAVLGSRCTVSFVECAPGGTRLAGGRQWKRFLSSSGHPPDLLSHMHFAVLGLGGDMQECALQHQQQQQQQPHKVAQWIANRMTELQGNRVFPVTHIAYLSQIHSLGIPWFRGVMSAMTNLVDAGANDEALVSPVVSPSLGPAIVGTAALPDITLLPTATMTAATSPPRNVSTLFLYGSVTGNAEAIARDFHGEALQHGLTSRVASLDQFEKMKFLSTAFVVIVCCTTCSLAGEGGACPLNAQKFLKYLNKNTHRHDLLASLRYAVLALGSNKYPDTFCAAGKLIDDRLESLGGHRVCPTGYADDLEGLEVTVESWRKRLFATILPDSNAPLPLTMPPTPERMTPHNSMSPVDAGSAAVGQQLPTAKSSIAGDDLGPAATTTTASVDVRKVLVMFGSQKGNAESIASLIYQQFSERQEPFDVQLCALNDYDKCRWRQFSTVIIVCSTTGEGEFPDNACLFYKFLRQKSHPDDLLVNMKYAVLGLGDTNYSRFCQAARTLDRRLEELGASRFYARGEADDAFGLEGTVEPWIENVWPALHRATAQQIARASSVAVHQQHAAPSVSGSDVILLREDLDRFNASYRKQVTSGVGVGGGERAPSEASSTTTMERLLSKTAGHAYPILAKIRHWRRLTNESSENAVIHLNLEVPEATKWSPGDAISILPFNNGAEVEEILERLRTNGEEPFLPPNNQSSLFPGSPVYSRIAFPITHRELLSHVVSLRIPRTSLKQMLAVFMAGTNDATERALLTSWAPTPTDRITLLGLLKKFYHACPSFRHVVEHLMVLQPRCYSICSAKSANPTCLSICFKVVPHGVCTNWLLRLCERSNSSTVEIPIALRDTAEFRVPTDIQVPLILIGPGTGVSPFMSFLQHRRALATQMGIAKTGDVQLFFGCRTSADYIFREELDAFAADRTIENLYVAFSQDDNPGYWYGGQYVQDKMQEVGQHLCELMLHHNVHVFVCGDAEGMARDVHRVLIDILEQHLRWDTAHATEFINAMAEDGRYQRDIWTSSW